MTLFEGFDVTGVPENGVQDSVGYWLIHPKNGWTVHDNGTWLEIGGATADGISWALKRDEPGVFAHYPYEDVFLWKARDVESLISGWRDGQIFV